MSLSSLVTNLFKPSFDAEDFAEALASNDVKYVAKILKFYPDIVHWTDLKGRSALNIAVANGQTDMCKVLIDANADINRMDPDRQMQPLNIAVHRNSPKIAEMLIDKGADVNAPDALGQTPIYMAIATNPIHILRKLVTKGANINVVCSDFTPLMLAAMADNEDSIRFLLRENADISIKKTNGVTADRLARSDKMRKLLGEAKRQSDAFGAAALKAKAEMDAIRAEEMRKLEEKAAVAKTIDSMTAGTDNPVTVAKPLRLRIQRPA